jgi:hypothetical protein
MTAMQRPWKVLRFAFSVCRPGTALPQMLWGV